MVKWFTEARMCRHENFARATCLCPLQAGADFEEGFAFLLFRSIVIKLILRDTQRFRKALIVSEKFSSVKCLLKLS